MAGSLILVANPGSASRKYGLYDNGHCRAAVHFEWQNGVVQCTLQRDGQRRDIAVDVPDLQTASDQVVDILRANDALQEDEQITRIGLRVVAPGSYFLEDHLIDDDYIAHLTASTSRAPLHIVATLQELQALRHRFAEAMIVGVSDSAFHCTKPDYAWNYGISLEDADRLEIKRFGYHGISVASVVRELRRAEKLPTKLIVCHLGSGASVTAVHAGTSVDTTMGYSPLEGVIMSTRSGSIDPTAVQALQQALQLDAAGIDVYLNHRSGLLGLGGSSEVLELLQREAAGDNRARLALATYVHSLQKAIGQMAAVLNGADMLVCTGTVGERSSLIRERLVSRLHYLDFMLDDHTNQQCTAPQEATVVSRLAHSKPIIVLPTQEAAEIARHVTELVDRAA